MKGMIVYYSFGGSTRALARALAAQNGCRLCEIKEKSSRSIFSAFLKGCRQAIKRQKVEIVPPGINWTGIERIIVACPIWAGYPAPAFNSIMPLLPRKMPIELYFVSGSGSSAVSRAETERLLSEEGYNIISYTDVASKSLRVQQEQQKKQA